MFDYQRHEKRIDALGAKLDIQARSTEQDGVEIKSGTEFEIKPISWLFPGYLALGKLHMFAGDAGTGKTTLAMAMKAEITRNGVWPDGAPAGLGSTLMWSGEDGPGDTLLPRLIAMGADISRTHFVCDVVERGEKRAFDPATDMEALINKARCIPDLRLLVVDHVVNIVTGDGNGNNQVRRSLQPLVNLASTLNVAVLGISHFSKNSAGKKPLDRVMQSVAFGALPRIVLVTATAKDGEEKSRIITRAKSNIGPDGGGFEFSIEQVDLASHPGIRASRVIWGKQLDGTAAELLADVEGEDGQGQSVRQDAVTWLTGILKDGPLPKREIIALAQGDGYAERTVQRAREKLGVNMSVTGFGKDKISVWSLPNVPIRAMHATENGGTNGMNEGSSGTNGGSGEQF
jgi:putative DNA primase/helicase